MKRELENNLGRAKIINKNLIILDTFVPMEKEYKPFHVLLFIVSCLLLLGSIIWFVPSGKKSIGNYEFRFLSQNKFAKISTRTKVDLDSILADIDTTMNSNIILDLDSIPEEKEEDFDIELTRVKYFAYNEEGQRKLIHFFKELHKAKEKKVRILHYGDSQIEGDRLTAFFRQRLQDQFGGVGPGFIPAVNTINSLTYTQTFSDNFIRYTNYFGNPLEYSNSYGIMNIAGRFTPEDSLHYLSNSSKTKNDSVNSSYNLQAPKQHKEITKAWIEIVTNRYAYSRAKTYSKVDLHYTEAFKKCKIKVYINGELIRNDSLIADGKYHIYSLNLAQTPERIRYEFESTDSPIFLGYSLEGGNGVLVDNIAMRGSSGFFFGKINQSLAKRIYDEQNVELFIMQFGGNSIPYLKDSTMVKNIAAGFKGQLNTIKRLRPDAAIIVIGPSDMSTLIEGEYTTYPLLPYFVECLKKNTVDIGGAYYDLYASMGGKDAMVAWVENELAAKDYVHFSTQGSKIAGQKFYDTFINTYQKLMKK